MKTVIFAIFFIALFYVVRKTTTFHATIQFKNHTQVFVFVSTVDNFQILNPTITGITNLEKVNETSFYLEYEENLSQLPFVKNYGRAVYRIEMDDDGSHDLISQHSTCFFMNFFCITTDSILSIFQAQNSDVSYREKITYSCPWILTSFCFEEISSQRKLIILKLKEIFSSREQTEPATTIN